MDHNKGFFIEIDSKEIITESKVDISFIPPHNPGRQPSLIGILIIKGFKPQFQNKQYLLKLSDKTSGKVRITTVLYTGIKCWPSLGTSFTVFR
jgi:hypothetical protein